MTSGLFGKSGRLPSESALCRRFGASLMTVRGALAELQRRGLIEKRNGVGSFLTKRALRKSGVIGLVIPDLGKFEFFSIVRKEIARHCARLNYRVELVTTDKSEPEAAIADIRHKVRKLAAARAEGVIFRPYGATDHDKANLEIVRILRNAEIPVVLIDTDVTRPPERSECDLVAVNNIDAGRRIADHLHERGYRHIAFLTHKDSRAKDVNWENRLFGLAGELALLHCDEGVRALRFAPEDASALRAALRGARRPDAIVCGNDECAVRLMETLHALGKRIPEDVAVVGFDDNLAQRSVPALTTVAQPIGTIAATAFKVLLARIRYPNNEPREIFLPAPIVIRASTSVGLPPSAASEMHLRRSSRKTERKTDR